MYEELIKRLRASVDGRYEKCDGCPYEEDYPCCVDCLDKMHKQAADAIEELSKPRWIPVTERLPSNGTNVLVFEFGRVEQAHITTYTADRSLCWVVINGGSYHRISEADCPIKWWMPLPKPPKEGET